jgi:hypothetical protein
MRLPCKGRLYTVSRGNHDEQYKTQVPQIQPGIQARCQAGS